MSEKKSNLPMIVIGFVILAIAAFFGLNMGKPSDQTVTAEQQQSPAPAGSFEKAEQAAKEATDKAQEAAAQAAQGAAQATQNAADQAQQAAQDAAAEANGQLSPAAGTPAAQPAPAQPNQQ